MLPIKKEKSMVNLDCKHQSGYDEPSCGGARRTTYIFLLDEDSSA